MKSSHLIFTLCAVSTSISYSMQLTLKANPHKLKQIRYITSQKELQPTSTKTKKQKNNQCNHRCIVEKKEQVKDFVVQTSNALQSCFPTYNSKYDSKIFIRDCGCSGMHIAIGMFHACYALATLNPIGLIPIITNAAAIKSSKLDRELINSVERPQLATDLISYLNAINREGIFYFHDLLSKRDRIEDEIRDHKQINTQTLSSLDLKNALNDYNVKLIELEKSKDIINNKILEPILPILNKYKNVDIEKCLTYKDTLMRTAAFKTYLLIGRSLAIYLSTFGIVMDSTDNV